MRRHWLCWLCCLLPGLAAASEPQEDGQRWLERMVGAAHKLDYSGTFVFQNAAFAETSRIVHLIEAGHELERIEVLDGSPREVLRSDDEVKCYLPESRTLIIEKRGQQRSFPALAPAALAGLKEYYSLRKGPLVRVAGRESLSLLLEPRDGLRYGRQFWADTRSGLLLKAALLNERGEAIETFTFTQLQIGGVIEKEALSSRYATASQAWQVRNVHAAKQARGDDSGWKFKTMLPGFSKRAGMLRGPRPDLSESMHLIFSDGLAAISIFIEPLHGQDTQSELGMLAMGATNVYQRVVGDHLLVLMGEVPQATLKLFGDGIEEKKR